MRNTKNSVKSTTVVKGLGLAVSTALLCLAFAPSTSTGAEKDPDQKYRKSKLTHDKSEMSADHRKIILNKGEDKVIDLDFDAQFDKDGILVGDPTKVVPHFVVLGDKKQLVLRAASDGLTNITIRDTSGVVRLIIEVQVKIPKSNTDLMDLATQMRMLLKDVEGIDIKIVGDKIVIDGELLTPADYGRLTVLLEKGSPYADKVINLAILSPIALGILAKRIQADINGFAPEVRTRVVSGKILLEGSVDSGDQARRALKVALVYVPDVRLRPQLVRDPQSIPNEEALVQSFLRINEPPPKKIGKLVRLTVHFVELTKDYNKVFAFKWQPGFTADGGQLSIGNTQSGTGTAGASGTSFSATISSLFPTLQSAQTAGYARVLKIATVMARNGQAASVTEESAIPFSVSAGNGQTAAQTATVGTRVAATPLILGQSDDVQLDVVVTQNSFTGTANNAPIITTHTVDTKLYVRSSESAAIAGLNSTDVQTNFNRNDPRQGAFTGPTSPLFTLLRSKNYTKSKGQFVVFVTPQIVENASEGTEDLRKNFRIKVK